MLTIGISGKRHQGKTDTTLALAAKLERCTIISVYDIVKFFCDYQREEERDCIVETIRRTRGNYLVDTLKLQMTLKSDRYDAFIIDDIFDSILMNQIKTELNAYMIGVERPSLHNLPISIRGNVAAGVLGEPDYVVHTSHSYLDMANEIGKLMAHLREKGIIAADT